MTRTTWSGPLGRARTTLFLFGLLGAFLFGCVAEPEASGESESVLVDDAASGGALASGDGEGDPQSATGGKGSSGGDGDGDGDETSEGGPLFPEAGKRWLFVGQDLNSIVTYADAVATPPGVVGYTSLERLEGLTTLEDHGGGPNHMHALAARFPEARIALGLYLVDHLEEINAGQADQNIDELARILALYDRPVLLRVGYEFDAEWTHHHPAQYIDAYRRIVDRVREYGTDNVAFVWQSAALCVGRYGNFSLDSWYPGDDYVDYLGLSYFTQGSCGFGPVLEVVDMARDHGKPVFVAEATPQGYDITDLTHSFNGSAKASRSATQIWSEWFAPFFDFIEQNADVVRAVTYINADWDSQGQWGPPYANGYWGDTRVEQNGEILAAWQSELQAQTWQLP